MVVEVVGLLECIEKFGKIEGIDFTPVIIDSSIDVQATAIDLAPNSTGFTPSGAISKSTGELKGSIHRKVFNRGKSDVGAVIYTALEHGFYNEFGTRKMQAQPFMLPAIEFHKPAINERMKKFLSDQLEKAVK